MTEWGAAFEWPRDEYNDAAARARAAQEHARARRGDQRIPDSFQFMGPYEGPSLGCPEDVVLTAWYAAVSGD